MILSAEANEVASTKFWGERKSRRAKASLVYIDKRQASLDVQALSSVTESFLNKQLFWYELKLKAIILRYEFKLRKKKGLV